MCKNSKFSRKLIRYNHVVIIIFVFESPLDDSPDGFFNKFHLKSSTLLLIKYIVTYDCLGSRINLHTIMKKKTQNICVLFVTLQSANEIQKRKGQLCIRLFLFALHYEIRKSKHYIIHQTNLKLYINIPCFDRTARSVFNIHKFLFIASNYETIYRCSFIHMHFMMITANINGIQLTQCHKLSHQMRYLICQRILSSFLPNFAYVFKFARHTTTIYTCSITHDQKYRQFYGSIDGRSVVFQHCCLHNALFA